MQILLANGWTVPWCLSLRTCGSPPVCPLIIAPISTREDGARAQDRIELAALEIRKRFSALAGNQGQRSRYPEGRDPPTAFIVRGLAHLIEASVRRQPEVIHQRSQVFGLQDPLEALSEHGAVIDYF